MAIVLLFLLFFFPLWDTRQRSESQLPATEATAEQRGPAQEIPGLVAEYIRGGDGVWTKLNFWLFLEGKEGELHHDTR